MEMNTTPSAADIYADQKFLAALDGAHESLTWEQRAEREYLRSRVWDGQDHFGGVLFRIPEPRVSELQKHIDKIAKRAEKLNLKAPLVTDTGQREEQRVSPTKVHTWAYVAVNGIAPKINGWTFVATLQHEEQGNVIRRVPRITLSGTARKFEDEDGLAAYRQTPAKCDHCQKDRRRKDTYVVVHEDGRSMQVGTNCLADFTGHGDPQQIAKGMEDIFKVIDKARDYETNGWDGIEVETRVELEHFLTHVAWAIRNHGWVSRSRCSSENPASADRAFANMNAQYHCERDRETNLPLWEDPTEEDAEMAKATIEWVRKEFDGDSDYASNLVTVFASDTLSGRNFGLAASGVGVYQRELEKQSEIETRKKDGLNEHFGEVKDRLTLRLTAKRVVFKGDDYYGNGYYIHTLKDDKGRTFKWFGSYDLEEGKTYVGKWTIKGHSEWKGIKETRINRPHGLEEV